MDKDFWHGKWQAGEIGFHEGAPNNLLTSCFEQLGCPPGSRIFLPLCGKTRDIPWLLERGCSVTGIELSALAVTQLFEDLALEPDIVELGALTRYSANKLDIFVGDLFDLTPEALGAVQGIYDRAALVALPGKTRKRYADHLVRLTASAPQLLITFEYDQSRLDGPPFSVDTEEVARLYGHHYRCSELTRQEVPGGLKGQVDARESAWMLRAG